MIAGGAMTDDLRGDRGDDRFITVDTVPNKNADGVRGGEDFDSANVDAHDFADVEKRIVGFPVGRSSSPRGVLNARAGEPARLQLELDAPEGLEATAHDHTRLRSGRRYRRHGQDQPGQRTSARPRRGQAHRPRLAG